MAWIANQRREPGGAAFSAGRSVGVDATRVFLGRVYRLMALGLAVTGLVALMVAGSPAALQFFVMNRGVFFGAIIAQLGMVMAFSRLVMRTSAGTAMASVFGDSVLTRI